MSAAPPAAFATGRTLAIVIAVAVTGFAAFLLLTAYGPDLRPGRDGGGHALSTSATGFKGIVDLLRGTGARVTFIRDPGALGDAALVVATPGPDVTPKAMRMFLDARGDRPTLIVLPKWSVQRLKANPAWVEQTGLLPEQGTMRAIGGVIPVTLCRAGQDQRVCGPHVRPVPGMAWGMTSGTVLARIDDRALWVLADPDMLDNRALATAAGARDAVRLLDAVLPAAGDRALTFDLTLNGFARQPNLLKLAFEPPFLSLTLCLLAATALAVFHASVRFGLPDREGRALAFGKRALVENIVALLRLAGRSHRTGTAYAALVADDVARATATRLGGDALVRYLDGLGNGPDDAPRFSALARAAAEARDDTALLAAAQALHRWKGMVH